VTGLTFPTSQPQPGQAAIVNAFPNLTFTDPLFLTAAPGDATRLYVATKPGRIYVFDNDPATSAAQVFLDLSGQVRNSGEQGLLGLAFDPGWQSNRRFYVYYSANSSSPGPSVISRFTATGPTSASAATESVVLQFSQPYSNHNGGMIAFGPDGKLYVAVGDGGNQNDPGNRAQDLGQIYGKLLRINADGSIPSDNPFTGQAGARGEIWAYGLRNPWRFSFDRDTGDLWCGDVGQDRIEEVDVVRRGGNYGWKIFEGDRDATNPGGIDIATTDQPVHVYTHSQGASVIGGYVYRGSAVPSLRGAYMYADYVSGRVWALVYDGSSVVSNTQVGTVGNPASFGEDAAGEVYICALDDRIYKFEEQGGGGGGGPFPQTLSATGLFADTANLVPAAGLVEYDVNSPLWSDGARKRRWIALPGTARITFHPTEAWTFPQGTVLVKHFELDLGGGVTKRLETRVLIREEQGWAGYTYRWNAGDTDADLLADTAQATYTVADPQAPGGQRDQTWTFPSRADCLRCHTEPAGRVLGVRTGQLNRDFDYGAVTDNQLRAWNHIGLFTTTVGNFDQHLRLPDPADAAAPVADRARSYLDVNCAFCHRAGGTAPVTLDLRWGLASSQLNAVDVVPTAGDLGLTGARVIAPGSKESSVLWERLRRLDTNRMPPLGTALVDDPAAALIGTWIDDDPFTD